MAAARLRMWLARINVGFGSARVGVGHQLFAQALAQEQSCHTITDVESVDNLRDYLIARRALNVAPAHVERHVRTI